MRVVIIIPSFQFEKQKDKLKICFDLQLLYFVIHAIVVMVIFPATIVMVDLI